MGGVAKPFALLALGAAILAGCSSQPTFTASEFINRINAKGVSIQLGQQLATTGDAKEVYAFRLPPLPGEPKPPPGSEGGAGASGSLYVFRDSGGAQDQLEACRAASGLICFRAANIAVILDEDSGRLEAQRLAIAVRRLAD